MVSSFKDSVNDVALEDNVCETCMSKLALIKFQKREDRADLRGCIVCDDSIDELLETRMVKLSRFGKRGRGRRGRGRGRRPMIDDGLPPPKPVEKMAYIPPDQMRTARFVDGKVSSQLSENRFRSLSFLFQGCF